MPVARGRQRGRPGEDEVRRRWEALSPARRQAVLTFEDPALLGKIREALATLYERQSVMKALGLSLGDSDDPLEASTLLKQGFEFSWAASRNRKDPSVVMLDTKARPVLAAKADFVGGEDFMGRMSSVLPDFLAQKSRRQPTPRALWKDIFPAEPANVVEMEQQLARLAEQALWAMALDPAFKPEETPTQTGTAEVELEPWMEEHDARVRKRAARPKGHRARAPQTPLPLVVEEGAAELLQPAVIASHYWRGYACESEANEDGYSGAPASGAGAQVAAAAPAEAESAGSEGTDARRRRKWLQGQVGAQAAPVALEAPGAEEEAEAQAAPVGASLPALGGTREAEATPVDPDGSAAAAAAPAPAAEERRRCCSTGGNTEEEEEGEEEETDDVVVFGSFGCSTPPGHMGEAEAKFLASSQDGWDLGAEGDDHRASAGAPPSEPLSPAARRSAADW